MGTWKDIYASESDIPPAVAPAPGPSTFVLGFSSGRTVGPAVPTHHLDRVSKPNVIDRVSPYS